jgi:OmpA-OmpF porin, OOP family
MKTWISKVAIGAALAAASSTSMAMDGNFFVNGEVAGSNVNINNLQNRDDTSTAGALRFGYMWNQGPMSWGVETGYVDLGSISGNDPYGGVYTNNGAFDQLHLSVKTYGEMLGGNFKLRISDYGWFFSSRLGLFHSQTTQHASDTLGEFPTVSSSANGTGAYAGVGFGYDFNTHIGISLNYDVFETRANGIYVGHFNTSMYGGTFEYRF